MKIDRLFTLSQFVDEIALGYEEDEDWMTEAYLAIHRYNKFLKQPLKKEMFVCDWDRLVEEYDMPRVLISSEMSSEQKNVYVAAQKKVIFEDCVEEVFAEDVLVCNVGEVTINYFEKDKYWYISHGDDIENLHDLAEATKGQLKLKNVEL